MNRDEMALRILLAFIANPPNRMNNFIDVIKASVETADRLMEELKVKYQ
jgi:hypothetical protein